MKRLIGCNAVAVLLLAGKTVGASGRDTATSTTISKRRASVNDAVARAAKLLSEIDPAENAEAYPRASATLVW